MNKLWNRIFLMFIVFFVFSLNCIVAPAQRKIQTNRVSSTQIKIENRRAKIQKVLQEFYDVSKFPGAVVGVAFADGSSSSAAIGYANRDAKTPMRESDLLHAGSVGKTFFAALVLQLIAEKRLELDGRIIKYLGKEAWFSRMPNGEAITVRMLLNHTSGLPPFGSEFMQELARFPSKGRSPLEGVKSILDARPLHPAGTKFSYSDVNYLLLGLAVESVTGRKAYDEIQRRLLKPLNLRRTVPADRPTIPGLVPGYAGAGNPFGGDQIMKDGRLIFDPRFEWAGGGFVSSAEDLARWFAGYCQGRGFDPKLLAEVFAGVDAPELGAGARYGLGVVIQDTPLGEAYGHGGFFPGYVTWVRYYPKRRIAVALQLNTSDDDLIKKSVRDVLNDLASTLS
jgi:D-alanyl-D-alanine carboxypeptidase